MASASLPIPTSTQLHQRTFRWVLMAIVVLAAFLVAVVGRPPAAPIGSPSPGVGLVGVSQPTGVSALPLH